jgi:N-acetyl-gamma-glutamylphosphate reductase
MEYSNNPFFLADEDDDIEEQENTNQDEVVHDHAHYSSYDTQDNYPNSPKLINVNKTVLNEITSFFKLDNIFTCVRNDEKKDFKKNISISKIIMDNIIDKKLGSTTYHYAGGKSFKAYYTYDYPEIYYNKKLYNNISEWLKEEFSKKI